MNNKPSKTQTLLPAKIKWDGNPKTFMRYRNAILGHLIQLGMAYLLRQDFLKEYKEKGLQECSLLHSTVIGGYPSCKPI